MDEELGRLISEHLEPLRRWLITILNNETDADDAVSDTVVRVLLRAGDFRRGSNFRAWIYRIAFNVAMDYFRRRGRYVPFEGDLPAPGQTPDGTVTDQDLMEHIQRCLGRVDPARALALELYYLRGLTYPEVARVMGVSVGTAHQRVRDGRNDLRRLVQQE